METVHSSVTKSDGTTNALLKLLQDTLDDVDTHENYTKQNQEMFNATGKRLVTNIRSNLKRGVDLCIQEKYEPLRVILGQVRNEIELERKFFVKRDVEQTQKITQLEVHIERLSSDIEKLHTEITRLTKENTEIQNENRRIHHELSMWKNSAARRQIALNIEHEIKKELFTALGWKLSNWTLRNTTLFKLRAKFLKEGKLIPKVLGHSVDLNDDEQVENFDSIMWHMKEFSRNGAHPVALDDGPITEQKAIDLIQEPFSTTVPQDCRPWNSVKHQAIEMVQKLRAYRGSDENFIKML